ncbi:MAG: hypothetical protein P8X62_03455 [Flavobacteriaceae bacterium]
MKKLRLIRYVVIVVSGILFTQCTSEYEAIVGPAGIDGVDGVDGIDGVDGSAAVCIDCHSQSHREGIYDAYYAMTTNHSSGSSWARGTSESCAACHNNEGFVDYIETGAVATGGYNISNPITCTGCHSTHRSFDFENDGNDYAVRTLDGVDLRVFAENDALPDYTIDYGNASNLCANCHQPRRGAPTVGDYPGKYLQTSGHWGPHHGPQTALLEGILGAYSTFTNIVEDIPATASATHRTDTGACIDCHMRGTTDGSYGHTWNPAGTNCASCHSAPFEELKLGYSGYEEDIETLGAILENVVGQAIERDSNGEWVPVFEADGVTPVLQYLFVQQE